MSRETKAEKIRKLLPEIADLRRRGEPWREVAHILSHSYLIPVTADEIRSYWGRFADGAHPAELLVDRAERHAWEAIQPTLIEAQQKAKAAEERLLYATIGKDAAEKKAVDAAQKAAEAEEKLAEALAEIARLQAHVADLEADLSAVDIMALGVGQKRRHRPRYIAGSPPKRATQS